MFDKPTMISASKDAMMLSFVTQPAIIEGDCFVTLNTLQAGINWLRNQMKYRVYMA